MGVSMVGFTKDLLLSSVQKTDQGLYQCIASNAVGERSTFIGLVVEAGIDSVITNLKVTVDHENAQFNLKWHLPQTVDYLEADRTMFLLNYYLSDGGSANNVPLRNAHCTPDNYCVAKCCSSNYIFFPRRNYTFQMSLFKMDAVGKITPLSEHVTAMSWDGVSLRSMELTLSRLGKDTLEISWEHPSIDIANGFIQKYIIEYYKDSEVHEVKRKNVSPNSTTYILNDIKSEETYRFRVIPVTRRGLPSDIYLKSNANFTFIGYMVELVNENFRPDIGSLPIDIEQKGALITIHWGEARKSSANVTSLNLENKAVLIRYAVSDRSPLKEKVEEGFFINGAINLTEKFDASRTYQFCSRIYDGLLYGPDFCRTYRLSPAVFTDIFGSFSGGSGLPSPVSCHHQGKKCHCEPSYEFGDAMRVTWDWPADDYSVDEFVVHYTLTDSMFPEDDRLVITDEPFADLPNLRSNTTYRIMIEPRNKMGGVKGSWFNCTTPILGQIPAPTGVMYEELNATAVRVSWNPIYPNPHWSTPVGYVIQVQLSSTSVASVKDIFVDGISATSHVIALQPNILYTFQVAARSSTGDLGQRSSPYLFVPSHLSKKPDGTDIKRPKIFLKSSREGILIGIVLVVGLLTLCFGGICAHLRLKRRKLEMGMNANTANNGGIDTLRNNSTNYEMEALITQQRSEVANAVEGSSTRNALNDRVMQPQLNSLNSLSNEIETLCLDTKGGEQGALPSGQDKYLKLLNDKKQLQRFKECCLLGGLSEESSVKSHISCRKKTRNANRRNEPFAFMTKRSNYKLLDSKWMRTACSTSDPWTGSLPSKKRIMELDSAPTKVKTCYLMTGRMSVSSFEIGIMMPRFLSKLAALSDVTRRNTTSYMEPLDQVTSYTSIICPRSASVQSLDQHNCFVKQRNDSVKTSAPITTNMHYMNYPCNTPSSQSLTWYDAGSIENDATMRLPRDASKLYGNNNKGPGTFCCSMPNLTDSGIVYDEMHFPRPPPLSPPPVDEKHLESCHQIILPTYSTNFMYIHVRCVCVFVYVFTPVRRFVFMYMWFMYYVGTVDLSILDRGAEYKISSGYQS
uniref:Fibronectin type-III domain-containing protein n=1 Tax=Setaria digitata TaxID=48799 RepID=A0A915Q231_9BILA